MDGCMKGENATKYFTKSQYFMYRTEPHRTVQHHRAVQSAQDEAALRARNQQSRGHTAYTKPALKLETNPIQQKLRHRLQARRAAPLHDATFKGMIGRHRSVFTFAKVPSFIYLYATVELKLRCRAHSQAGSQVLLFPFFNFPLH